MQDYIKHKLSITVEEDTLLKVRNILRLKSFRNKSHFFEVAADELLNKKNHD